MWETQPATSPGDFHTVQSQCKEAVPLPAGAFQGTCLLELQMRRLRLPGFILRTPHRVSASDCPRQAMSCSEPGASCSMFR